VDESPTLDRCLAYAVLSDYRTWIGPPSVHDVDTFLRGASARAELVSTEIATWRIFGPFFDQDFAYPLTVRTGNPTRSINWASALDLLHFDPEDAIREALELLERWQSSIAGRVLPLELLRPGGEMYTDLASLLSALALRPVMFLGPPASGWTLRSFLHGMAEGGDWLGLPPLTSLSEVIDRIEQNSCESYGSRFGAYRAYDRDLNALLSFAGVGAEAERELAPAGPLRGPQVK